MTQSADSDDAWVEFQSTGTLGRASVALLAKLTGQIAARTSFPPPPQHRAWDHAAIIDFIGGMIAGKNSIAFVQAAALKSRDQPSFERQLIASIENWLKDQSKMTIVGRMRRRLVTLLGQDSRFERATLLVGSDAWTLPVLAEAVWQGDEDNLFESTMRTTDDGLSELNPAGKTSKRNIAILVGYAHHLLTTALGALRDQLIARFVVRRYELDEPGTSELRDDVMRAPGGENVVEDEFLTLDAKEAILAVLSGRDQVALALHETPSVLASRLHLTQAEAEEEISNLLERLRPLALRNEIGLAALKMVIDECFMRL